MPDAKARVASRPFTSQNIPLALLCLAATAGVIAMHLVADSRSLLDTFGDSDDATRLIQIRAFLEHGSWFDTTLMRFGGDTPLVSHWSRLLDLPVAFLIKILTPISGAERAEFMARAMWPAVLLFGLCLVMARAAERQGGQAAAVTALVLLLGGFLATTQFWPGRIDHHGAQILASVTGVILLAGGFQSARLAAAGGLALALSAAIGFESLILVAGALALFVILAGTVKHHEAAARHAALAFAGAAGVAFLLNVAASDWLTTACDSIAVNSLAMIVIAGTGTWMVLSVAVLEGIVARLAGLATVGAGAAAFGVFLHPACLAGPFGDGSPELWRVWLDHVGETQSFAWLWNRMPGVGVTYLAAMASGIAAALWLTRREPSRQKLFYCSLLIAMAFAGLVQLKLIAYAAALSILPLAIAIARLPAFPGMSRLVTQFIALVLSMQLTISAIANGILSVPERTRAELEAGKDCRSHAAIDPLADLEPGLMVSDIDSAAAIVAGTRLDAFAAPYHRLDRQILETRAILRATPSEAEWRLAAVGADYVVLCTGTIDRAGGSFAALLSEDSLLALLGKDRAPAFLSRLKFDRPTPLAVWRFKRQ